MLILYHAHCTDGACAAWAAGRRYPNATLLAVRYQEPPPDVTDKDVLIVDFSYPRAVLLDMHAKAKSLRVFDHHKTAAKDLEGLDFCVFDMERSGAGITWDELHDTPRPWLVDYVEDRDLWRWALSDSETINAYLQTVPRDPFTLNMVNAAGVQAAFEKGCVVEAVRRDYIQTTLRGASPVHLPGVLAPALGVNMTMWANSEVIGERAESSPSGFALGYVEQADGRYKYSLRARKGGPDVAEIAKRFGGGGHAAAASFVTTTPVHTRTAY